MKFCLNSRVSSQYLKTADQIKVAYRDFASIPGVIEKYPDTEIIVSLPNPPTDKELEELRNYNKIHQGGLKLAFSFFPLPEHHEGLHFYTSYPVESFSEANALISAGSECIKPSGSIFFQMDRLKKLNTQIRLTPNQPWLSLVPRENGICGQWIRPEDLYLYDSLSDPIVEFDLCRVQEEEALYRIYSEDHKWSGPLSYLVQNLNDNALNRLLEKGIGITRMNCGHKCQDPTGSCRICPNAFKLANMLEAKNAIDKE